MVHCILCLDRSSGSPQASPFSPHFMGSYGKIQSTSICPSHSCQPLYSLSPFLSSYPYAHWALIQVLNPPQSSLALTPSLVVLLLLLLDSITGGPPSPTLCYHTHWALTQMFLYPRFFFQPVFLSPVKPRNILARV